MALIKMKLNEMYNMFDKPSNILAKKIHSELLEKTGKYASAGEWKSWATTLEQFTRELISLDPRIGELTAIIEYLIPWNGKRIDIMITGKEKIVFLIELKGWNILNSDKNGFLTGNTSYEMDVDPIDTINEYADAMRSILGTEYIIHKCLVLPNLLNKPEFDEKDGVKIYYSESINILASKIIGTLNFSENVDKRFTDIQNYNPMISLKDSDASDKIVLSWTQQKVFEHIKNEINTYSGKRRTVKTRKVIFVKGEPGSGKTLILLKLLKMTNGIKGSNGNAEDIERKSKNSKVENNEKKITKMMAMIPGDQLMWSLKKANKDIKNSFVGVDFDRNESKINYASVLFIDEAHKNGKGNKKAMLTFSDVTVNKKKKTPAIIVVFIDDRQQVRYESASLADYKHHCDINDIPNETLDLDVSFRNGNDISFPKWAANLIFEENDQKKFINKDSFMVHTYENVMKFIHEYEKEFEKNRKETRIGTLWFVHPSNPIIKNGTLSNGFKIGDKKFFWNIKNGTLEKGTDTKMLKGTFDGFKIKNVTEEFTHDCFMCYYHHVQGLEFKNMFVYIPDFFILKNDKIDFDQDKIEKILSNSDYLKGNGLYIINDWYDPKNTVKRDKNLDYIRNRLYTLLTRATENVHIFCENQELNKFIINSVVKTKI